MGLDTVELVLATEAHFNISLPDDEVSTTETLDSLCRLIQEKCVYKKGLKAVSYDEIYAFVSTLLLKNFSVPADKIYPKASFVKTMGLD